MTVPDRKTECVYLVPSRTLAGTPEDVLAQIDEAVQELLALRHLIAVRSVARPVEAERPTRADLRLVSLELQSASAKR